MAPCFIWKPKTGFQNPAKLIKKYVNVIPSPSKNPHRIKYSTTSWSTTTYPNKQQRPSTLYPTNTRRQFLGPISVHIHLLKPELHQYHQEPTTVFWIQQSPLRNEDVTPSPLNNPRPVTYSITLWSTTSSPNYQRSATLYRTKTRQESVFRTNLQKFPSIHT